MSLQFERHLLTKTKDLLHFSLEGKSLEQEIKLRILRDLWNLDWDIEIGRKKIEVRPPAAYDKPIIQRMMGVKRDDIIQANRSWIDARLDHARTNLADGFQVLSSEIKPVIEVCETTRQHELFRMFRYYWSSPYSDYVGRRIKLIIRDAGLKNRPVIGIAALGSPIIHIPERDDFIGWDKATRTKNLIYTMDAFAIGALPPYNYLLGGKLVSMILASNEVRKIYQKKYRDAITIIEQRKANKLVGIFTTSLYGRSSQYNRLTFQGDQLFKQIGYTKGYGTLHLSNETINSMVVFLKSRGVDVNHRFGDGPSWVMRVIRSAGDLLGFDADFLMRHSFRRSIYFVPLASNSLAVLNGVDKKPTYFDYPLKDLVTFWKQRWLENRKLNPVVIDNVLSFSPENFDII